MICWLIRNRLTKVIRVSIFVLVIMCQNLTGAVQLINPDVMANAEVQMWKAYYAGDKNTLYNKLVELICKQHGLPLTEGTKIAELFANSIMKFNITRDNYESDVLPDLTKAYSSIKLTTGGSFDANKVAKLELAWWIARRTPGQDSVDQVGKKIAKLYAALYGKDHHSLLKAGYLRAKAAKLRDVGGANADWTEVQELLKQSYKILKECI